MVEITPRWEWRSFGRRFGEAETRLAALAPGGVQESDEIYLLSGAGANVKVRDALLDIKVLRQVNADGLEQWMPVMKAGFPLPAAEAAKAFEALRLPVPSLSRASYTLEEIIKEFAALGCAIREVKVHKRRTRYTVGGCMAELCDVVANGKFTRTIAVESEDAARVIRAVKDLGLGGYMNTSYPRGLTALIDDEPARYAVIDVGTNSVKLLIGERDLAGAWRTVVDRAELTRLGEGLEQHRVIIDAALERTASAIAGMADEAKRHSVLAIAAVGTAGLRIASNRNEVIAAIEARTGLHIEVIPGEEEGRLAYVAAQVRARDEPRARSWCSTPEAAVRSSHSGTTQAWTSGSASTSAPCVTPSASSSTVPCQSRCCTGPWRRFRRTCRASRDVRFPPRWWRWVAR